MSQWSDGHILANGINIHYYRTGGDKSPVVLLHGFTDDGLCWTRVARDLEQDYDVILVDARGHGLSDGPEAGFSSELLADDVASLIQTLGLKNPSVMGHSMGAATAAIVAANYAELVRAIVLEDPPWHDNMPVALEEEDDKEDRPGVNAWEQQLIKLKSQTREERIASGHAEHPTWAEVELGPWADSKARFNLDTFKARFNIPPRSWREIAQHITCPILLITGDPELGAIVTPEVAQEVSHLLRNGQVVHISGAGHNIRREQYDKYMEAVITFLKEK